MPSDRDYAELLQRVQFLENRLGTWATNGLDAFDTLGALELGSTSGGPLIRMTPDGFMSLLLAQASQLWHWQFVRDMTNPSPADGGATVTASRYSLGSDGSYAAVLALNSYAVSPTTAGTWRSSVSTYTASVGTTLDEAGEQLTAYNAVLGDSVPVVVRAAITSAGVRRIDLEADFLQFPTATADPTTILDGAMTYRTDTDKLRLRANGAWVSLADTAYVDTAVAGAGTMTMPVMVSTRSAQSIGSELAIIGSAFAEATFPASNRAIAIPFTNTESITVVKMWALNGGVVSGNIDIGIYDEDFAKVVTIGSTAQAGVSIIQEFNIADTVLAAGRYYMVVAMDNTTGELARYSTGVENQKSLGLFQMASAFALPTTLTPADVASAYVPVIGFSLRTLVA